MMFDGSQSEVHVQFEFKCDLAEVLGFSMPEYYSLNEGWIK